MGKNFESIKVDQSVRRCLEKASIISDIFSDKKVRSAYVIIAAFSEKESMLSKFFQEDGLEFIPEVILSALFYNEQIYSYVFGKEAADLFFKKDDNNGEKDSLKEENEIIEKDEEEVDISKIKDMKELKSTILDTFTEMILFNTVDVNEEFNLEIVYSDELVHILEDASIRCLSNKQDFLDMDNLIYSLISNKDTSSYKILEITIKEYNYEVSSIIDYLEQNGNIYSYLESSVIIPKSLENCCTILNDKFTKGEKSDILGRDKELFKLWNIFSKKTKRNSALIGHPGVGKTAIVEALTQNIVNKACPKEFYDYTVVEFDVGAALAGTKYRGEFEEKISKLKNFLQNTSNVILFVDEMHQMIGAGSSSESGGVDLSGALKPILSRDDVIFIGSTTIEEYEKHMSKDLAFKRRFEPVIVKEPRHHEVYDMIKSRVETLSKYHDVSVSRELIDYIIVCASVFNKSGHNPDISIDLCDRSMAIAKMRNTKVLEKRDIEKVNEEGYEKFEKFSDFEKKSIAVHESAHYYIGQQNSRKNIEKTIAITIVPSNGALGFYRYEIDSSFTNGTQKNYLDEIYSLLAGRAAQEVYLHQYWDDGAKQDIEMATNIAQKMITELSLVSFKGVQLPIIFADDYKYISDSRKEMITKKAQEIVSEAYNDVVNILYTEEVKEKIMKLESLLLNKKIVTAKELEECIK